MKRTFVFESVVLLAALYGFAIGHNFATPFCSGRPCLIQGIIFGLVAVGMSWFVAFLIDRRNKDRMFWMYSAIALSGLIGILIAGTRQAVVHSLPPFWIRCLGGACAAAILVWLYTIFGFYTLKYARNRSQPAGAAAVLMDLGQFFSTVLLLAVIAYALPILVTPVLINWWP